MEFVSYVVATSSRQLQERGGAGGVNARDFRSFLDDLGPLLPTRSVIVLDNARIHHAELLRDTTWPVLKTAYGIDKVYLPAYSPFLNPIEYVFNTVKKRLEAKRLTSFDEMKRQVDSEFRAISSETATKTFAHCLKYYEQARLGIPFSGRILAPNPIPGQPRIEEMIDPVSDGDQFDPVENDSEAEEDNQEAVEESNSNHFDDFNHADEAMYSSVRV